LLFKLETFPLIEKQIKSWLKVGVLENDLIVPNEKGTPQGSFVSPLLMNIALHGLEDAVVNFMKGLKTKDDNGKYIVKRRRASSINTIRYADDFVILHEHPLVIKECKKFVQNFLSTIGLTLNENKTRVGHRLDWFEEKPPGLDFLGSNICQYKIGKYAIRKTEAALPYKTLIRPSKSKVKEHYKSIKEIIIRVKKTEVFLMELNPKILGWAKYYRTVVSYKTLKWLNTLLFKVLLKCQYKKHPTRSRKWLNKIYYHTKENRNWVFGIKSKDDSELITVKQYTDILIDRFVKVKGIRSPYDGDALYGSSRLNNHPITSTNVSKLLEKQKGRCNICKLQFFLTDIIERDHIVPLSKGGSHKLDNIQLLHAHCHQNKTAVDLKRCETREAG
jgi:RNA-directed DNA polymerase